MLRTVALLALSLTASTVGSAAPLYFIGGGTFSSSVTADPFVSPGATFRFTFVVPSNPVTNSSNSTSVSFDLTPTPTFSLFFQGAMANLGPPSAITFSTAANGGGVTVNFASAEFILGPTQYFSGPTSAPVFAPATFSTENFIFLDSQNNTSGAATAQLTPVPEPSPVVLLCGGLALLTFGLLKFKGARK